MAPYARELTCVQQTSFHLDLGLSSVGKWGLSRKESTRTRARAQLEAPNRKVDQTAQAAILEVRQARHTSPIARRTAGASRQVGDAER